MGHLKLLTVMTNLWREKMNTQKQACITELSINICLDINERVYCIHNVVSNVSCINYTVSSGSERN